MKPLYLFQLFVIFSVAHFSWSLSFANTLEPDLSEPFQLAKGLAQNPEIILAVKKHNEGLLPEFQKITNDSWVELPVSSPLIKTLLENQASTTLKAKIPSYISEFFISGADGKKVGFSAKTTSWNHSGKPKHDDPMKGKDWKGKLELDKSTGVNQIQISVPILDENKPIGSMTLGVSVVKFKIYQAKSSKQKQ